MQITEIIKKLEEDWKARRKGRVFVSKGVHDTDHTPHAIHYSNFDQVRGAIKLIRLLSNESEKMDRLLHGKKRKVETEE